jgi:hypothetical protein
LLFFNKQKSFFLELSKFLKADSFKHYSVNKFIFTLTLRLVFQIDIQEFYESILLDEQRDRLAKMDATLHLAEEWEKQPMLKRNIRVKIFIEILFINKNSHLEWYTNRRITNDSSHCNK